MSVLTLGLPLRECVNVASTSVAYNGSNFTNSTNISLMLVHAIVRIRVFAY